MNRDEQWWSPTLVGLQMLRTIKFIIIIISSSSSSSVSNNWPEKCENWTKLNTAFISIYFILVHFISFYFCRFVRIFTVSGAGNMGIQSERQENIKKNNLTTTGKILRHARNEHGRPINLQSVWGRARLRFPPRNRPYFQLTSLLVR